MRVSLCSAGAHTARGAYPQTPSPRHMYIRHLSARRTRALLPPAAISLAVLPLLAGACHRPVRQRVAPPAPPAVTAVPAASQEWTGAWQLVGHGFPDGSRWATFLIERLPSGELTGRFTMQGPPGDLQSLSARGDSLHVRWLVSDGGSVARQLEAHLGGIGDTVMGYWKMDGTTGPIEGRRLRD